MTRRGVSLPGSDPAIHHSAKKLDARVEARARRGAVALADFSAIIYLQKYQGGENA
jgi:hypothetical protein